jgi:beta propeller repeat protein
MMLALLIPAVARASTMDVPAWSQTDPRWSGLSLGGTSLTMYGSGCAVTASAMVASYYSSGKDPGQLCQALNANGGLANGELQWVKVPAAAGGTINGPWASSLNANNVSLITSQLDLGFPVLVWFYVPGNTHWVVLTGHDGGTYYMNDPNGGAKNVSFNDKYGGPGVIQGFVIYHGKSLGQYARHIVQQKGDKKKQKTSWYVSADLRRLWIPDAATFNALRSMGAPKPDVLTSGELDALPDQKNCWAAAGSAMTKQRTLRREMALRSANNKYTFTLRSDGNLALTGPGNAAIWDAKASGIDYLVFQKDGNLAGYKDGVTAAVWSTQTAGKDARRFVVRNDGVAAVLDADGKWLWSTRAGAPTATEFAICTAAGIQWDPAISGTKVVWVDFRNWTDGHDTINDDIYGYDLTDRREFPICTAPASQSRPDISGNIVVWQDWRYGDGDIFGYDLLAKRELAVCTASSDQWFPKVDGETVIWADDRYIEEWWRYVVYRSVRASTEYKACQIAIGADIMHLPDISGGLIVRDHHGQDIDESSGIYGYDIDARREVAICSAPGSQWAPRIEGGIVAWQDDRNGTWQYPEGSSNSDIYAYDVTVGREFPVCTASGNQWSPAVSSDLIVWVDYRKGNADIFAYDLTTKREFPVCTAPSAQSMPGVFGNTVVWVDYRNGDADIYGAAITR